MSQRPSSRGCGHRKYPERPAAGFVYDIECIEERLDAAIGAPEGNKPGPSEKLIRSVLFGCAVSRFSWSRMTSTAPPGIARLEGALDHYSGDEVIVFFNDPLPTLNRRSGQSRLAIAMREAAEQVRKTWRRHGHDLGFSVGISQGFATLGQIGFAECMDYTAIGQ